MKSNPTISLLPVVQRGLSVATVQDVQPLIKLDPIRKVPVPDEKTVRDLNRLASRLPFCRNHQTKKYDTL